ncbi:MAG TPA: DNA recombination protein RmuC, partial [Bacteroidia bacterium]|nr:DNA recombination protein RmuC [Bacteroidia bacterium]
MMNLLFLSAGILIGVAFAWLYWRGKTMANEDPRVPELDRQNSALAAEVNYLKEDSKRLLAEKEMERKRAEQLVQVVREEKDRELAADREQINRLTDLLARREAELKGLDQKLREQKEELEKLQQAFTKEFENLANKIFEEKSKKFTEQNKTNIDGMLKPLGEKLKDFEKKVNDVYVADSKERATLKEQLSQLHVLNQQMSKDAQNLARALKGESKTQGNWGEFILETVLQKSGLTKDREYRTQQSFSNENGSRFQPDVIIDLPDEKHLVIDSKMSLLAYERFCSSDTEDERLLALKEHTASVRRHIKELSEKKYQDLYQLNSLDFVLLFIPVEPAFAAAVQADGEIFNDAFSKNIVIVSPSTLLATLRTVANIWRQENQNRNVMKIADEAAAMYDKFVLFTESMIEMGRRLDN